jgi:hypothetical protein
VHPRHPVSRSSRVAIGRSHSVTAPSSAPVPGDAGSAWRSAGRPSRGSPWNMCDISRAPRGPVHGTWGSGRPTTPLPHDRAVLECAAGAASTRLEEAGGDGQCDPDEAGRQRGHRPEGGPRRGARRQRPLSVNAAGRPRGRRLLRANRARRTVNGAVAPGRTGSRAQTRMARAASSSSPVRAPSIIPSKKARTETPSRDASDSTQARRSWSNLMPSTVDFVEAMGR